MSDAAARRQVNFSRLPPEIWSRIFQLLAPEPIARLGVRLRSRHDLAVSAEVRARRQHLQLREVCRTFNTVFLQCQPADENLVLCGDWAGSFCADYFIQVASSGSLRSLLVYAAPFTLRTSLELAHLCKDLSTISIGGSDQISVELMSALPAVTSCQLHKPREKLNLSPLSTLQHLTSVTLQEGEFDGLPTDHLTKLEMLRSEVECVQYGSTEFPVLEQLVMHRARLYGINGTALWPALKSMTLCEAAVVPGLFGEIAWLDQQGVFSASATSALPCLTHLQISMAAGHTFRVVCELHRFASLSSLVLHVRGPGVLEDETHGLTKLTALSIKALPDHAGNAGIRLGLDWRHLKALEHFKISGPMLLDQHTDKLRYLSRIKHVDLQDCWPCVRVYNLLSSMPAFVAHRGNARQRHTLSMSIAFLICFKDIVSNMFARLR